MIRSCIDAVGILIVNFYHQFVSSSHQLKLCHVKNGINLLCHCTVRQIITGFYANQLATPVLVSQQAGGPKSY